MGSILPRFTSGPRTYEAVEAVVGGQLLEARAGGVSNPGCGVAADASVKVIGVAQKDATVGGGAPRGLVNGVLDQTLAPTEVAVYGEQFVPIKYSVACAYGIRVCSGGAGTVRPWVAGTDPVAAIVGRCDEGDGVVLNGTGMTKLFI